MATVAFDVAKLVRIERQWQKEFEDRGLNFIDIAGIIHCAKHFGVLNRHAYLRAKALRLLSYQEDRDCSGCGKAMTEEERQYYMHRCEACERAWHERIERWRHGEADEELDLQYDGFTRV